MYMCYLRYIECAPSRRALNSDEIANSWLHKYLLNAEWGIFFNVQKKTRPYKKSENIKLYMKCFLV